MLLKQLFDHRDSDIGTAEALAKTMPRMEDFLGATQQQGRMYTALLL